MHLRRLLGLPATTLAAASALCVSSCSNGAPRDDVGTTSSPLVGTAALVFSISQGEPTEAVSRGEGTALWHMALAMWRFKQAGYPVYALINPQNQNAKWAASLFHDQWGLGYFLDVVSSDTLNLVWASENNQAANWEIGLSQCATPNDWYARVAGGNCASKNVEENYPDAAGLRIFEPEWMYDHLEQRYGSGAYTWVDSVIQDHVSYAHSRGLPVLYDSTRWQPGGSWALQVAQGATDVARSYPGTVDPTYPTNTPNSLDYPLFDWWKSLIEGYTGSGGLALSDQSWLTGDSPSWYQTNVWSMLSYLWNAENNAVNGPPVAFVEIEPNEFFFDARTPPGWAGYTGSDVTVYGQGPTGWPTWNLYTFAAWAGVDMCGFPGQPCCAGSTCVESDDLKCNGSVCD
jgi:hypothetical protein